MKAFPKFGSLAVAAGALMCAVPAQAEIDELVRQAVELERTGQMGKAYQLLAPQLSVRAGDPDFDYAFGIAAVDAGHVPEGILAFQRVLALQPDNAQARAEIARAYARMGDVESARAQFETVLGDPSIPDPVRQRFTGILRDLDRKRDGGGTDVAGYLEAAGGFDSNINAATNLTSITLPLLAFLGPASLSGAAVSQESGFFGTSGGISVRAPFSAQTSGFASVLGDSRFNTRNSAFDQITAAGTAGLSHTLASSDVASLSGQYQRFWLGGDHYRTAYGVIAQYTKRLAGGRALSFGANWYRLDYPTDPLRDADRYTGTVTYAGRMVVISASGGKENVRRAGADNLSNGFASINVGLEKPLSSRVALVANAAAEMRRHDAADPLFLERRHDVQLDATVGLKALITGNLYLRPSVSYARNISNLALYDYRRFTASLAVRAEF